MGPIKNITHYISHIIQLGFPTKNTHHVTTKIEPQNYVISTKKYPKSFNLWAKHKGPTKPSYKAHYDMASLKPTTMWHLQSPLRCSISTITFHALNHSSHIIKKILRLTIAMICPFPKLDHRIERYHEINFSRSACILCGWSWSHVINWN